MIDTGPVLFEYQNRPYIPVRINGQGPFSFLLDTGARGLNLSDDLTDELGLEPDERYVVQVDDFSIGAASFQDLLLPLRDNVRVSQVSKRRVDGFIGSLFLSDFTLTIDYPDHSIRITDEQAEYATEPAVMRICNGYPLVAVQIQDSSVWFLVDTGTSKCIVSTELSEQVP